MNTIVDFSIAPKQLNNVVLTFSLPLTSTYNTLYILLAHGQTGTVTRENWPSIEHIKNLQLQHSMWHISHKK